MISPRPNAHLPILPLAGLALALGLSACGEEPPPAWTEGDGHRWRPLEVEARTDDGRIFTLLESSATGIEAANVLPDSLAESNRIFADGSGVAVGDVDGDGRPDVYLARIARSDVLYRNTGDWEFEDVTERAGLGDTEHPSKGATLVDVDGDGDLDLLVTILGGRNRLFRNDGTGSFEDVTASSGLDGEGGSTTATLADVDGDGDLDLYVSNYKSKAADDIYSAEEVAFDNVVVEEDGEYRIKERFQEHYRVFDDHGTVKRWEYGEPDAFYLNEGSGRFRRVDFTSGRFLDESGTPLEEVPRDWGLAARFHDLNGDGAPDLYVCNDFESPDHIWMNDGSGSFRAIDPLAVRKTSMACMSVDFSDVDRDGFTDYFTTDMLARDTRRRVTQYSNTVPLETRPGDIRNRPQVDRNTLQVNRGDGTFAEIAFFADAAASGWSWTTLFMDADLDGFEDLLIVNGHRWNMIDAETFKRMAEGSRRTVVPSQPAMFPTLELENVALRNRGDRTFEDVSDPWGFGVEEDISHGMGSGDMDGDGDLDLVVTRLNRPPAVYRNDVGGPRIAVRLRGPGANTAGVGATVRLGGPGVPQQRKEMTAGGLYLSSAQYQITFAAPADTVAELRVRWPDGRTSRVQRARPDRLYEIRHPDIAPGSSPDSSSRSSDDPAADDRTAETAPGEEPSSAVGTNGTWFEDRSEALGHRHAEAYYDDFRRQPLLPMSLAQPGPGVAWHDADRDGDPDLFIGSGKGGRLAYYRNDGGRLRRVELGLPISDYDQTALVGLPGPGPDLLVGQSVYEATSPQEASTVPSALGVTLDAGRTERALPPTRSATGPLALADVDGDLDLDLFAGGRVYPTAYPVPPDSRLYENRSGRFVLDSASAATFAGIGMVSGAVFSDLDMDGDPDLLLALDWGPVRVFENDGGSFRDVSEAYAFGRLSGRWNGIATGDLNEDGRPDVILTGWGTNGPYRTSEEHPVHLYYGDLDNNGTLDLVEGRHSDEAGGVAPLRRLVDLGTSVSYIRGRMDNIREAGSWTVERLLGPRMQATRHVEAQRFAHTVFLSDGDGWREERLPPVAQYTPAFHAAVADLDGDGHEDLFLSQNFFPTRDGVGRYDAGRGLILRGDGTGSLEPVPGQVSGIEVYGDSRGAAVADYDADGRVDVVVSQNGARTRLFHNRAADPGLRVRLRGPAENPDAVGARLRVLYPDGEGPTREIQAGSGYWSQNGTVQVLGLRETPRAVRVTWPDGTREEMDVAPGARTVTARWRPGSEGR